MTKQEQIEQMARITCQMYCRQYEKRCAGVGECDYKCLHYQRCEVLYDVGYHKQPEWISVEDRLPEIDPYGKGRYGGTRSVRVLCVCKQRDGRTFVKEGYYEPCGDGSVHWRIPGSIDSVTHWMPLPTPPTEKEN